MRLQQGNIANIANIANAHRKSTTNAFNWQDVAMQSHIMQNMGKHNMWLQRNAVEGFALERNNA